MPNRIINSTLEQLSGFQRVAMLVLEHNSLLIWNGGNFFFFLISNKYALIKGKPKYTGSEQGKRNYKQKLQESRKSIKEGKD